MARGIHAAAGAAAGAVVADTDIAPGAVAAAVVYAASLDAGSAFAGNGTPDAADAVADAVVVVVHTSAGQHNLAQEAERHCTTWSQADNARGTSVANKGFRLSIQKILQASFATFHRKARGSPDPSAVRGLRCVASRSGNEGTRAS